jgi:hypothetical protein
VQRIQVDAIRAGKKAYVVHAERVEARRVVYLDHNVWIELRDGKTEAARSCRSACEAAFDSGSAIFPASFASIVECAEIEDRAVRLQHADLIDRVSNGVTFRLTSVLMRIEAQRAHYWLFHGLEPRDHASDVFTTVGDYLDGMHIDFSSVWSAAKIDECLRYVRSHPKMRSVRFVVESDDSSTTWTEYRIRYVDGMRKSQSAWACHAPPQKDAAFARALLRERIGLFREHVLPASTARLVAEVGVEGVRAAVADFRKRKGDGSRRRIKEVFARCPIMDLRARLLARDTLERYRHPRHQDFFDFEHAAVAPLYADAFVTLDSRLRVLIAESGRARISVLSSLEDLTKWLPAHT